MVASSTPARCVRDTGRGRRRLWAAYLAAIHLLLLAAAGVAAVAWQDVRDPPDNFRREMLGHLARLDRNIGDGAALFLGSSSVHGLHVAELAPNAVRLGIGGERIDELRQRMAGYASLGQARLVVLAIGYNDLRVHPPEVALATYRELLSHIPSRVPLVVSGVQMGVANPSPGATHLFNAGIRDLCARRSTCAYVDLGAVIDAPQASQPRRYYEDDGVHLNAEGYAAWKRLMRHAIERLGLDAPGPLPDARTRQEAP